MRAAELSCPHCHGAVLMRELEYPSLWANYRVCPHCEGTFIVDVKTRRLQAIFIGTALVSLVLTILLYFVDNAWLIPALASYALLAFVLYRGNRNVFLVPWTRD